MRHPFMEAIRANPDDDLPRLVFADWLEEKGDAMEAKFIRFHCYNPGQALILDYAPHRKELHEKNITVMGHCLGFATNLIFHTCPRLDMLLAYGFSVLTRVSGSAFKDNLSLTQNYSNRVRGYEWSLIMGRSRYSKIMYDVLRTEEYKGKVETMDLSQSVGRTTYLDIYCTGQLNPHRQHELLSKLRSDIRLTYLRQEYLRYVESKGFRD